MTTSTPRVPDVFFNIWPTFTGRSVRAERVSGGTFTLVTSLCVEAGSSAAQHGVPLALVDVCEGREGEVGSGTGYRVRAALGKALC